MNNEFEVPNEEQGTVIAVCRAMPASWDDVWPLYEHINRRSGSGEGALATVTPGPRRPPHILLGMEQSPYSRVPIS